MRRVAATVLVSSGIALGLAFASSAQAMPIGAAPPVAARPHATRIEYYCSEGFAPTSGGRCVATAARDEIELYLNDPGVVDATEVHHRRHRHHGLRERY